MRAPSDLGSEGSPGVCGTVRLMSSSRQALCLHISAQQLHQRLAQASILGGGGGIGANCKLCIQEVTLTL